MFTEKYYWYYKKAQEADRKFGVISNYIRLKILNRIRQFGFKVAIIQVLRAIFRKVYEVNEDIVFVANEREKRKFCVKSIKQLSEKKVKKYQECGELSREWAKLLLNFVSQGCMGLHIEINGKLAAYSWIQFKGEYEYGKSGKMAIPANYAVFKNLYVFPEFRGKKLGQKLNEAKLELIASRYTALIFIMSENRYALRNWRNLGARRICKVKRWHWFRGNWRMALYDIDNENDNKDIVQALVNGHIGKVKIYR